MLSRLDPFRHPGAGRDLRPERRRAKPRRDPGLRRGDETWREREGGFTLVEMMVVIVIIGLLATIVIINVMPAADRAAVTKARADIATLEQGIDMYRLDNLRFPTTDEGLQALMAGNYLRRLPNDPWNRPYQYAAPGPDGKPFLISSLGADGRAGGDGENADITN
ncbi:type II secretion system major pseudopilin GspG [Sphingosinicella sp. LHD-64]|uniref:type II secretion system major pseudopilin GspG n=1 Tax=Sphingosinicella sp. LHD-64 TaxID=3072139 RepID=UPI00280F8780|nr:type II secretion system major pseudopilin GspG [Sphingosinicella sp. LHD-64]MDQ8755664.1 type II secretion system major pseudopilin GspG [Sphingosinicella sp. LHD-64]